MTTPVTAKDAAHCAEAFGIHKPVERVSDRQAYYEAAEESGLIIEVYEQPDNLMFVDMARHCQCGKPVQLPSMDEAKKTARLFCEQHGVMPAGDVSVWWADHNLWENDTPYGCAVVFRRKIDGYQVLGEGRVAVEFAYDGNPVSVTKVWRQVKRGEEVPLISVEEAYARAKAGKAGFRKLLRRKGTAEIKTVEIAYWERSMLERQEFLEPVYRFAGTLNPTDKGKPEEFEIYVPAVDWERVDKGD